MRASFLIVVACFHLGGSYYNQTSLSSVLSAFEARLTVPRSKDAEQSAPVPTAVPTSAAAIKMPEEGSAESASAAATRMPEEFSAESTASATRGSADVSTEGTSAAVTKMLAEISTVSTEPAVTKGTTKVSTTTNPTFLSNSIGEESPTSSEGLPQEREVDQVEDTAPRAALPSHVVAYSGSSRVWTYKEVSLVAHVSQVMWLTVLTGISAYFLGANAHLWRAVDNLRRARA